MYHIKHLNIGNMEGYMTEWTQGEGRISFGKLFSRDMSRICTPRCSQLCPEARIEHYIAEGSSNINPWVTKKLNLFKWKVSQSNSNVAADDELGER